MLSSGHLAHPSTDFAGINNIFGGDDELAVSGVPETEPLLVYLLSCRARSNTGQGEDDNG